MPLGQTWASPRGRRASSAKPTSPLPRTILDDWRTRLDDFLRFNERAVLPGAGQISREEADRRASEEYATFEDRRRLAAEQAGKVEAIKELEQAAKRVAQLKPAKDKSKKRGKG